MPLLNGGSIDHEVRVTLSDEALDAIENAGHVPLNMERREELRQLAFSWAERRETVRPEYKHAMKMLTRLIREALPGNAERFFERLRSLGTCNEHTHPTEAYVYEAILTELKISAAEANLAIQFLPVHPALRPSARAWNADQAGKPWRAWFASFRIPNPTHAFSPNLERFRVGLMAIRSRLQKTYHGKRGGSRDHDLGWVLPRLAEIYTAAGGEIRASAQFDAHAEPFWTESSDFIQFCRAFVDGIPHAETARRVDVGGLVREALEYLRAVSKAYKKR